MANNDYTVTNTAIINAQGQEIGDLRRLCIIGPEEHPLSFGAAGVPLTYRRVNCPAACDSTVEII